MAAFKKVAIVGAAGNLGSHILKALLESKYDVTVISRAGSTSVFQGVPEHNVIRGEYTPEFFRKALTGQEAVVMALGSSSLRTQEDIIDAAAEVGVKRIIPSEFGSDITNSASLKAIPFNAEKKVVADYLEKVVATHPQTTWTGVTSGPFFDWCLDYNIFGIDIKTHHAALYDEGKTRFDVTNISSVAKAVAKILSMPEKFQNERVQISGMAITQLDIFEAFKKATAPKEWSVSNRTAESLRQDGNEKLAKKDFSGILDIIGASLFQDGNGSCYSESGAVANEQLGIKDDLYQSVEKHIKAVSSKA